MIIRFAPTTSEWRDVEGYEQRAGDHQEKLGAIACRLSRAGSILIDLSVARLLARDHCAKAGGHALDCNLADTLLERHRAGEQTERVQHDRGTTA